MWFDIDTVKLVERFLRRVKLLFLLRPQGNASLAPFSHQYVSKGRLIRVGAPWQSPAFANTAASSRRSVAATLDVRVPARPDTLAQLLEHRHTAGGQPYCMAAPCYLECQSTADS